MLTGAPAEDSGRLGDQLASALEPWGFAGPGFASRTVAEEPLLSGGGAIRPGAKAVFVSGIARSEPFLELVRRAGFEIAEHLDFKDHHAYPPETIARILDAFKRHDAELVLTTGKDRVKLQGRLEVPLAEIPIRAEPETAFFEWLDRRLAEIG